MTNNTYLPGEEGSPPNGVGDYVEIFKGGGKQAYEDVEAVMKAAQKAASKPALDPRDAPDIMGALGRLATNGIPNGAVRRVVRDAIDGLNGSVTDTIKAIDAKKLRDAAAADGIPGYVPSGQTPPPPGMEWQPRIRVSDDGRRFDQAHPLPVPIGTRLPPERPYYIDKDGNRIYPPANGWIDKPQAINPNADSDTVVSDDVGNQPDPQVEGVRYVPRDPLVLDMDGDGIELQDMQGSASVFFDFDGDGTRTATAWVRGDDGLVVLDRNGNGLIDNGTELFGDQTILASGHRAAHGFEALADLDSNGDGTFNAGDESYAMVRIWQDQNQDGISQSTEMKSLSEAGIASINLNAAAVDIRQGDSQLIRKGTYVTTDEQTRQAGSYNLGGSSFWREGSSIEWSNLAKSLPALKGTGEVADLRDAATSEPGLVDRFQALKGEMSREEYEQGVEQLLFAWARTSSSHTGNEAQGRGYAVVASAPVNDQEKAWLHPAVHASDADRKAFIAGLSDGDRLAFTAMRERMVGTLEKLWAYEVFSGYSFLDWSRINRDAFAWHPLYLSAPPPNSVPVVVKVSYREELLNRRTAYAIDDKTVLVSSFVSQDGVSANTLWKRLLNDALNNLLVTTRLAPFLDQIQVSWDGTQVHVDYSAMNVALAAAHGADQYENAALFLDLYRAVGQELIRDGWTGEERLLALLDASVGDAEVRRAFSELGLTAVTGASGTLAGAVVAAGTSGGDNVSIGNGSALFLDGGNGNDTLRGGSLGDRLLGGAGDDYLSGRGGNDMLDGGAGQDVLQGGNGADSYFFGVDSGSDTIYNYDNDALGVNADTVRLGVGITLNNLVALREHNDLILKISGNQVDKLRIAYYFEADVQSTNAVEFIEFADGLVLRIQDVQAMVARPTDGADQIIGYSRAEVLNGGGGNDTVHGAGGDDVLAGGSGEDQLYGDSGHDEIYGGEGNDRLYGGEGNDVLVGGAGNDQLLGGGGQDTYVFGRGHGHDTIDNYDYDGTASSLDRISLAGGLTRNDVTLVRSYDDLIIRINDTQESLRVSYYFNQDGFSSYAIDEIGFENGLVLSIADVKSQVLIDSGASDTFTGYASNDSIQGGAGADRIRGLAGSDTLDGGDGDDSIYGGVDGDTLRGGVGSDLLMGEDGADLLQGGAQADTLYGGEGNDTLDGGVGDDQLFGGGGADTYRFGLGSGIDTLQDEAYAAADQDTLVVSGLSSSGATIRRIDDDIVLRWVGGDEVRLKHVLQADGDAGIGVDSVVFEGGPTWTMQDIKTRLLGGSAHDDVIRAYGSDDILHGLGGGDVLLGMGGDDELHGGQGDDRLEGGDGDDRLDGGHGNDTLVGGTGHNTYVLAIGGGQDLVEKDAWQRPAQETIEVLGSLTLADLDLVRERDDILVRIRSTGDAIRIRDGIDYASESSGRLLNLRLANGNSLSYEDLKQALLQGQAGDDLLTGYASNDSLSGGGGRDILNGAGGNDTLRGDAGDDQLFGSAGQDVLEGGEGDDVLQGGDDADDLKGGHGNDSLDGGEGIDTLAGGEGNDLYVVDNVGDVLSEQAGQGQDSVLSSVDWTLSIGLENLRLTGDLGVSGRGNGDANILVGNSAGNLLEGLAGSDELDGGQGADTLVGGLGDDLYRVDDAEDVIVESEAAGTDRVVSSVNFQLQVHVEELLLGEGFGSIDGTGNALANRLTGNEADNVLDGGAGADTLEGGLGDDTYVVDSMDDVIVEFEGAGDDTVRTSLNFSLNPYSHIEHVQLTGQTHAAATGNGLDNSLLGNDGNNRLDGGLGADRMAGGRGNDTYVVDQHGDYVIEHSNEGIDTIERHFDSDYILDSNVENLTLKGTVYRGNGNWLNNVITGNDADNNLFGMDGNDTLIGGGGNDELFGGVGRDVMRGGLGDDYYEVDNMDDSISELTGQGDDFVRSSVSWTLGANVESLALDGEDDLSATGNVLGNGLFGNEGHNTLRGAKGDDFLQGSRGDDTYVFSKGDGQDTIDNTDVIGAVDTLRIHAADTDLIAARYGDDLYLRFKNSTDQIAVANYFGAAVNYEGQMYDFRLDRVEFDGGVVWNQASIQTMVDRATNNRYPTVSGAVPALSAWQGTSFSYVVPASTITDPDTWDSVTYSVSMANGAAVPAWLTFDATTRTLSGVAPAGTTGPMQFVLWGTDNYSASAGTYVTLTVRAPNIVAGTAAGETLNGGTGNDSITGAGGNDTLYGNGGNDRLDGGTGTDAMSGGAGDDIYVVDSALDTITELAGGGYDRVESSVDYALSANVEQLTLTGTAVSATGNASGNVLVGNSVGNLLNGGAGADTLLGGLGEDVYIIDNTGDVIVEQGSDYDYVESSVTHTLTDGLESLTLTGTANLNGTGNALDNEMTGNGGHNLLAGGDGNDVAEGGHGNDTLQGELGNDHLSGGAGADTLDGGLGQDTLLGGIGNDLYRVDDSGDVIVEEGTDHDQVESSATFTLTDGLEGLTLTGSDFIDGTGNALNNEIIGNSGNNLLIGGTGDDIIDGGQGSDTLEGGSGNDNLFGGVYDWATGEFIDTEADTLQGGEADDMYWITDTADTIIENANEGTDLVVLVGTTESHSITLADHVEHFQVNFEGVMHEGMANSYTGHVDVTGNAQANRLWGTGGTNFMEGGAGNDTVSSAGGNDDLIGGLGNDVLDGGSGNDTLYGGTYNWSTGEFADVEADTLRGGSGDDVYWVSNLNDTIIESASSGGGIDTVVLEGESSYYHVTLASNVEHFQTSSEGLISDSTANLYTGNLDVTGNAADNRIWGTAGVNVLMGGGGNDLMYGANGDDYLEGGHGNDRLAGGNGSDALAGGYSNNLGYLSSGLDTLIGGAGDDYYYIGDGSETVTETISGGNDTLVLMGSSPISLTLAANVENAQVGQDVDVPSEAFANQFYAAHNLTGNVLNNRLWGSAGANQLNGGAGNDSLHGAAGNDALVGGTGNDLLDGGSGNDTFYQAGSFGVDVVRDTSGTLDVIQFADASYNKLWLTQSGQNLELSVVGTADKVIVENWFSSTNKVEQMIASGHVLQASKVSALVQAMAGFSPQDLAQASSTLQAARDQAWAVIAA